MEHRELSPVYGVCAVRLPDGVQEGNVSAALVKMRENRRPRADCSVLPPNRTRPRGRTGRDPPPPADSRCRRDDTAQPAVERP